MECTQRLENTQEFVDYKTKSICPEQIGFLGICGEKYPIKKGPNKIGRDPTTCTIVLNLNSISRQHAVINILNHKEFMIMDLDSANKTKWMDKILQPYIPQPISNGDMVQFGDVFGVFRLLEEDTDLPMTQALDIPDTPITSRYVSKLNKIPITTIPESPDVSDKDDSFIAPSQPKGESCHKSNINFVKPSSKVISIQPIGSKKIDNIYWSSSKKSISLNLSQLNDSNNDLNDSIAHEKVAPKIVKDTNDIHEMETQNFVSPINNDINIYNMETQQLINSRNAVGTKKTALNIDTIVSDKPCDTTKHTSIYDMETQPPLVISTCLSINKSINEIDTQEFPKSPKFAKNNTCDVNRIEQSIKEKSCELRSIYDMETQPTIVNDTLLQNNRNIHEIDTQIITGTSDENEGVICNKSSSQKGISNKENKPEVCKIVKQHEMQVNLFTCNKKNEDIFTAETQPFLLENDEPDFTKDLVKTTTKYSCKNLNVSDEEILFEEPEINIDDDSFSQPLMIPEGNILEGQNSHENKSQNSSLNDEIKVAKPVTIRNDIAIHSDSSTDCEDIDMLPTQKIENKKGDDDDLTDCEDLLDINPNHSSKKTKSTVCFEEMATQAIGEIQITSHKGKSITEQSNEHFDNNYISDMPTQVLTISDEGKSEKKGDKDNNYHDLLTQVIEEDIVDKSFNSELRVNKNVDSPFKIPFLSPVKPKKAKEIKPTETKETTTVSSENDLNENYYESTQDIVDDLCSQKDWRPEKVQQREIQSDKCIKLDYSDFGPCSEKNFEIRKSSPKNYALDKSFESSDGDDKVDKFVASLSSQQIRNVIGVETPVDTIKKTSSSDLSDIESTPKKVRPVKLMDIDLPDSQEIKTNVSRKTRPLVTESSSESEPENDSEEQCTPILFRKNKKSKKDTKIDLTKKFDVDLLPTRVITRVRKPTLKFQINNEEDKKTSKNFLKPKFLSEQEEDIDKDIISENITRLKNKSKGKIKNVIDNAENKTELKQNTENSVRVEEIKPNPVVTNTRHKPNNADTISNNADTEEKVNEQIHDSNKRNNSKKQAKRESKKTDESKNKTKLSSTKKIDSSVKTDSSEINDTKKNTRVTRNRRNIKNEEIVIKKDKTDSQNDDNGSKTQLVIDLTEDNVLDVRRSNRVRTTRNKKEEKPADLIKDNSKSLVKNTNKHEQSAVYNVSCESVPGSPKSLKRSATIDLEHPKPKRTRSLVGNKKSRTPTPARVVRTQHVLFTAFPCEEVRAKLEKLGAVVVSEVADSTVVLTMQIKRTFKLLCAVGLGRPIVGPNWVQACVDSNFIVDPWLYILKDEAAEKRFQFNLETVLLGKRNFLEGFNVSSTPSVMPTTSEMKLIVECSGGEWREGGERWVCVSCVKDRAMWSALKRRGAALVSTEFILGGVLKQRADLAANKL